MDFILQNIGGIQRTRFNRNPKKNKTVKRVFKKMNCSPTVKGKTAGEQTCYTKEILMKIRDEYNKSHPDTKIVEIEPNAVWEALRDRLYYCKKEDCWLKELKDTSLRDNIDTYIFAPDSPPSWGTNPNEWLSNIDILNVLSQYQRTYKNFRFLGPSPIDFDTHLNNTDKCVEQDICTFSIEKQMKDKKNKIGIIFNLDRHDESGSHWVSFFIDLENKVLFFFDSAGDSIPEEIAILKDRIIEQGKSRGIKFKYYDNANHPHQKGNTECGVYSLFFTITMLTGEINGKKYPLKRRIYLFKKGNISDKYIEKYRKIYFN
jgi:hypothetical protein